MNELEQKYIDSREVAEMVEKAHKELMRDIRRYCEQLAESKIALGDFFTESTYADANNQQRPCYLVTKKGCEFIAHKLTGAKGAAFTAKYIERFHEMEQTIADHIPRGEELIALAVLEAKKVIEEKNAKIAEMTPKAIFADAVATSKTSILIGELAKIIKQNGVDTGEKRLFEWMRKNHYLISRKGSDYNMPTQRSMEMGLFEVKETAITHSDGHVTVSKTVKTTGKGQGYFINKFLSERQPKEE